MGTNVFKALIGKHLGIMGVDWKIILKCECGDVRTGIIWLRTWIYGALL
jgi:hypothetical protein